MTTADQQPITENNAHARLKGAAPSGVPWKLILLAAAAIALAVLFWDAAANLVALGQATGIIALLFSSR
ncbi:MAG: hypothetical protein R3C40_00830 [Parvularculaceae bacterium]